MKFVNIEGNEFIRCTAICEEFKEAGRRNAMLIHSDEGRNRGHYFSVYFDDDFADYLPEDANAAQNILEEYLNSNQSTLNTVLIDGKPISDFSWVGTK